ncbi:MAG: excinuclease ABC subunit C [Holophagales bacterium]|nr:excinuclease ABC subunit C [Holophagales bacterium]
MHPELSRKLGELPDLPGIYIFKSKAGEALYVGKAKSLRRRAAAYRKPADDPRIALMLHDATDVEFVVADSEAEALLFENNWIKRRQPRFNIRLRDDKTYPYLKLTLADGHPRLAFTRRVRRDRAEYYGPYLPAGLARKAIKLTQKLFGIRVCRIEIDGSLPRPCLYYDMKRCLGPCVDGLTTDEAYADAVEKARLFLAGRNEELLKDLRARMRTHADELDFEAAARVRDTIHEIDEVSQRRKLRSARGEDVDIFGVHISGDNAAVTVLVMRGGQVLDRRELFWEGVPRITAERLLSELLPQLYDRTTLIPREIHLPAPIEGEEALIEWLSRRRESRVYLRMPSRGPKAQRIALANRNAAMAFRRRFRGAGVARAGAGGGRRGGGRARPPRRGGGGGS